MKKNPFHLLCLILMLSACSNNSESETANFLAMDEHSGAHITFVDYLEETDEFAVELALNKDRSWDDWYQKGIKHCGRITYEYEYEMQRLLMPQRLAKEWADTRFLDHLHFYDEGNRDLGEAHFERYEFIQNPLSSSFFAIFSLDGASESALYAMGGITQQIPKIPLDRKSRRTFLNSVRSDAEAKGMKEDATIQIGIGEHYFSAFQAADPKMYKSIGRLYETTDGQTSSVMAVEDHEILTHLQPLPLSYKGKPVLLISSGIRNADVGGEAVFVYNGKEYVFTKQWGKLGKACD